LVADDQGLLATDESTGTCNKRFAVHAIEQTVEQRHAYRELLVDTARPSARLAAHFLFDETIRQEGRDSTSFVKVLQEAGLILGIQFDCGGKDLAGDPGGKITEAGMEFAIA